MCRKGCVCRDIIKLHFNIVHVAPNPPSHVQPVGDQDAVLSGSNASLGGAKSGSRNR